MNTAAILSLIILQATAQKPAPSTGITIDGPNPGIVKLGDSTVASIEIEGSSDCDVTEIPKVDGLEVRLGGRQNQTFSSFDGRKMRTRSATSFQLQLRPQREGIFEIPFLTVRIGAESYKTRAVRVEAVKDLAGSKYAFLEVETSRKSYFVNEPVRLKVRVGIDISMARNLLQMFNTHLDLPIQVEAPWLDDFPGGVPLELKDSARKDQVLRMAANRNISEIRAAGTVTRDGRTFATYEFERAWIPGRFGTVTLAGAMLRFRFATKIVQNVFGDPVPQDRQDAFVYGEPARIEVKPIPEDSRPGGYTGAVGKFRVSTDARPHDVKVGESIKFTFRIEGDGNLEFLEPPQIEPLEGFHVYGHIDEKSREQRVITYDLSPLNENVKEIPPITFVYFDTDGDGSFKTIRSEAIPIHVRALPPGEALAPLNEETSRRVVAGVDDIHDMQPVDSAGAETGRPPGAATAALAFGAPVAAAAALFLILRKREHDLANPALVRARGAKARFANSTAKGADAAGAFTTYLADRCNCNEAAILSDDLSQRLASCGISGELASRAASALLTHTHSRYAGATAKTAPAQFQQFVEEIEAEFNKNEVRA